MPESDADSSINTPGAPRETEIAAAVSTSVGTRAQIGDLRTPRPAFGIVRSGSAEEVVKWLKTSTAASRLPVPLLVGLRVLARRPRRVVLGVVSIAVTVSGLVTEFLEPPPTTCRTSTRRLVRSAARRTVLAYRAVSESSTHRTVVPESTSDGTDRKREKPRSESEASEQVFRLAPPTGFEPVSPP